eukprot:TRINITY_DN4255_c0_g2_i1.p1 TRINITY_DN4255_c0_g2~~TRINITY_DN4255_c0_g2_i1.p1  ORF type:complete len:318 (-),score=81.12 TRINITY_DN4255_c0_g2_i1:158-1111(-)
MRDHTEREAVVSTQSTGTNNETRNKMNNNINDDIWGEDSDHHEYERAMRDHTEREAVVSTQSTGTNNETRNKMNNNINDDIWGEDSDHHEYERAMRDHTERSLFRKFGTEGLREGIDEGKNHTLQGAFNKGFHFGAKGGVVWGELLGIFDSLLKFYSVYPDLCSKETFSKIKETSSELKLLLSEKSEDLQSSLTLFSNTETDAHSFTQKTSTTKQPNFSQGCCGGDTECCQANEATSDCESESCCEGGHCNECEIPSSSLVDEKHSTVESPSKEYKEMIVLDRDWNLFLGKCKDLLKEVNINFDFSLLSIPSVIPVP